MNIYNYLISPLFALFKTANKYLLLRANFPPIIFGILISSNILAVPMKGTSFNAINDVNGVIKANSSFANRDVLHSKYVNNKNSVALEETNVPTIKRKLVGNLRVAGKVAVACNDNAFITTGSDLINQIKNQGYSCVERLFNEASDTVKAGTFTEANIITVANEAKIKSISYNGTDPDLYLSALYYWTRAFYYYGNRKLLTETNQAAMKDAIDTLIANNHFFDKTKENASVIQLVMGGSLLNALIGEHYVPLVNDLLDIYDESYNDVPQWGSAFATIFWDVLSQCSGVSSCRASQHNTELVAKIGNFIHDNLAWLDEPDADYHLHNLGYQLARFYAGRGENHFESLRPELESQLHKIFDNFGPQPSDVARRAYLQTLAVVTSQNQCEIYNVCSKKEEIIASVLDDRINCPSGTLFMWAQDMNQAQLEWACNSLGAHETYFHQTLQTNNIPVTPDDNDILRMIVFNDSREWSIYGFVLFGASTNNGGLYLEGDPSTAGDQATFFAYEHVSERPVFDIWNLRHEYIHYLDGRFNTKGDFNDTYANGAGKTTWYVEGIAEYISLKDCNDRAIAQAANGTYSLSTVFQNEYGVGQDRIYRWGYLANRFMFEEHNDDFFSMLDLFRQGQYLDYRSILVDNWINNQTFDAEFADWLPTVESSGCEIDNTRPPSPIEPINIDKIQDTDQVGIDACALGEPVSQDFRIIQAGKAICLLAVSDGDQLQMGLHAPSGLVDVTLEITLRYGSGNANLLHKLERRPTDTVYDNISNNPGNEETILVNPVQQNWNYIHVRADTDFSGVTLLARYIQNNEVPTSETPIALTPKTTSNSNTPTFTWTEVSGAIRYAVVARDNDGNYLVNNSTGSNIVCPSGICSYTKSNTIFPDGAYSWNVRVINPDNSNGASSSTLNFAVDTGNTTPTTGEFTPLSPNGIIGTNQPTFTWKAKSTVTNNETYAVRAIDADGVLQVWNAVTATQAGCGNGTGTCSYKHHSAIFAEGSGGYWKVQDNESNFSSTLKFTINAGNKVVDVCRQGQIPVGNVELTAGNAVCLQDVSNGGQRQMHFFVPEDKVGSTLEVILSHGSGDGILLHKHDDRPDGTDYDHISNNAGNDERILVHNIQRQWNYIHVQTDTKFSSVSLLVQYIEK